MIDRPIDVVIADDHGVVKGLRALVDREEDMRVVGEANSGADVLDLLRARQPDVLLLDIRMPGMDGLETLRRIEADPDLAELSVIIVTTFEIDEYVFEALQARRGRVHPEGHHAERTGARGARGCRGRSTALAVGDPAGGRAVRQEGRAECGPDQGP